MAETQIQRIMSGLKCSEEEAREIAAFDKRIDRGERTEYDLSPEEEKAAKKWANTTSEKKAAPNYKWTTRERTPQKAVSLPNWPTLWRIQANMRPRMLLSQTRNA